MGQKKQIISLLIFFLIMIIFPFTGLYQLLVNSLIHYTQLQQSIIIFLFIYILCVLFISPWPWLAILSGSLYGIKVGIAISVLASIVGNMCAFILGACFFHRFISFFTKKIPRLNKHDFANLSLFEIFIIRASPVLPQRITNYLLGGLGANKKYFFISLLVTSICYNVPAVIIGGLNQGYSPVTSLVDMSFQNMSFSGVLSYIFLLFFMCFSFVFTFVLFSKKLKSLVYFNEKKAR